ncbi:MAG: stage II sporulation protein P [Lachnospiraceae bacterium]|nr:stage II sporulation protein P [Lachnospiraceae bacterium]
MRKKHHPGNLLLILLTAIAAFLMAKGVQTLSKNHFERGKEIISMAFEQVGNRAVEVYLPQVLYQLDYEKNKTEESAEIIEDESTSQAIIEENERAVKKQIMGENASGQQKNPAEANTDQTANQTAEPTADPVLEQQKSAQLLQQQATIPVISPIGLEQLQDFNYLLQNFFVVDGNTTGEASQINITDLWERDMTLHTDGASPQILIYHTHSQEGYVDSVAEDPNTTVIGVGEHLAQILRDTYGYQVLHNTDSFDLAGGQLDRSKAYNYAQPVIETLLAENPSIEVVIDLHRDGVDESKHLVTEVEGQQTAKIMFFNGLSRTRASGDLTSLPNPYIEDNLAFAFQLEYLSKQCYPDFVRCIYLKGYRYNLHVRPKSLLLEVGAQTNTVSEAMNAMSPFAKLLNEVLQGTNK